MKRISKLIRKIKVQGILLILILGILWYGDMQLLDIPEVHTCDTILKINMNNENNELEYNIKKIQIGIGDKQSIGLQIEEWIKGGYISGLTINNKLVYIKQSDKDENISKELLFSSNDNKYIVDKPETLLNKRYTESNTDKHIKTYADSFNNTIIVLTEKDKVNNLEGRTLREELSEIESSVVQSSKNRIILEFKELGRIYLDNTVNIVYTIEDKILRVYKDNEELFYISHVNNPNFGCYAEDLVATTEPNLYVHVDYSNKESTGYKIYAIKTDTNLYCFKGGEEDILNQLNIDTNIQIKKIQTVIDT